MNGQASLAPGNYVDTHCPGPAAAGARTRRPNTIPHFPHRSVRSPIACFRRTTAKGILTYKSNVAGSAATKTSTVPLLASSWDTCKAANGGHFETGRREAVISGD